MFKTFFRGIAIGIANIIPGVSGGTIAVVLGIYDDLIESIGEFFLNKKKRKVYALFLVQIGLGALVGILLFARVITFLLDQYAQPTQFLFIGLIVGSIPVIYKMHPQMKVTGVKALGFLLGLSAMGLLAFYPEPQILHPTGGHLDVGRVGLFLFSGFIAAGAMVIPGISGSFIIIILGTYHAIVAAVSDFNFAVLGLVGIGAVAGILLLTKGIDFCLKKNPGVTYYVILGLVLGSVFKLWPAEAMTHFWLNVVALGAGYRISGKLA
ncbi:MAG: putative membrane protein [Candidatus Marinamargulisbacteria bacterium]|jgi:putative membrane protein